MQIQIRSKNIDEINELREAIERQIRFALTRYERYVVRVVVTVADLNGPRGGIDKRCTVRVSGRPGWRVVVRDNDATVMGACNAALARTGRAVARRLDVALRRDSRLRNRPPWWNRYGVGPFEGSVPSRNGGTR